MTMVESLRFSLALLFACQVAADAGEDFSNNIFSDLAPLLALFGERVTMQFMSQSMGWADNIILAMAPVGIITAIVSAIRVGGPSWLKAIIGRARENLAVAEADLMSSTSNEVCELWNGREVVRCMGTAPVTEFICLLPETMPTKDTKVCPKIKAMDLDTASAEKYLNKIDLNIWQDFKRWRRRWHTPQDALSLPKMDAEHDPARDAAGEIVIIRNTSAAAPNILLNSHNQVWRGELRAVAHFATVLQLGVLMYSGFATYYPTLKFQEREHSIPSYAFPCNAIGTLILVTGMLLCAHVVESSTKEERYQAGRGKRVRLVWLQQTKTVNDQVFDSFAIYPKDDRTIITTSRRADKQTETTDEQGHTVILAFKAMLGTMIGLCGFVVQFIGLRGMHWSASVAQLGAVLVMVCLRAWVRRGLAQPPECTRLTSGFELEWFAKTLGDPGNAPWLHTTSEPDVATLKDWRIVTGGSPEMHQKLGQTTEGGVSEPSYYRTLRTGTTYSWEPDYNDTTNSDEIIIDDRRMMTVGRPETYEELGKPGEGEVPEGSDIDTVRAQSVMKTRRDLARLAHWRGPASAEAIALARAIEVTMDTLFVSSSADQFTWSLRAHYASSDLNSITFDLKRKNGTWKIYADEIEAALSLWLHSVNEQEEGQQQQQQGRQPAQETQPPEVDAWLRSTGSSAKPGLRLLGVHKPSLCRDFRWWMPPDTTGIIRVEEDVGGLLVVGNHRLVGSGSTANGASRNSCGQTRYRRHELSTINFDSTGMHVEKGDTTGILLASESYVPLRLLYAQDMFSSFLWAVAKTLTDSIEGRADIRPDNARDANTWNSFALRNARLSKLAEDIHSTGLGNLEETYLNLILPLSMQQKLPQADAIIEPVRQHARQYEQLQHWKEAGEAHLWLIRMAKTFPEHSHIAVRTTAVLIQFYRQVTHVIDSREVQPSFEIDFRFLEEYLKPNLERELRTVDGRMLLEFMELCENQGQSWSCFVQEIRSDSMKNTTYPQVFNYTTLHWTVLRGYALFRGHVLNQTNWKDIYDRTPLHYAAARAGPDTVDELLKCQADVNARDILERTPLHYACQRGEIEVVRSFLQEHAKVDARGRDGVTPLHRAAMEGHQEVVKVLIEAGAAIDVLDASGNTPLLLAAYNGHKEVVRYLWPHANKSLRNRNGGTPLHLAALAGNAEVVKLLVVDLGADKESKDRIIETPLHMAVRKGHDAVASLLLEEHADKEAPDARRATPLHTAAANGHEVIARLLIENGANIEAAEYVRGSTPLHQVVQCGDEAITRLLIESGANIEAKNNIKQTPLHQAAQRGDEAIMRLLIESGANIEAKDNEKQTPLHWAAQRGDEVIMRLLIESGANIEAKDNEKQTPLHQAAQRRDEVIMRLLIESGANIDAKNEVEWTLLHQTASRGDEAIMRLLIESGANIEAKDNEKQTPLHQAALRGDEAIIRLLIESGANIDAKNEVEWTLLHQTALRGDEAIMRLLIESGANIEAGDKWKWTPLHHAVDSRHEACARLLVDSGANIEAENEEKWTPLHQADQRGDEAITRLLVRKGANMEAEDEEKRTPRNLASENGHEAVEKLLG